MARSLILPLAMVLVFSFFIDYYSRNAGTRPGATSSLRAKSPSPAEAPAQDQLLYMGYLLYRTSNINVIKGLNLNRDQLLKLRALSREIENVVPPFTPKGSLSPDLKEVEKAYMSLAGVLMTKDEVSPDLLKEVARARGIEAKVIKKSLCYEKVGTYGDCMRCHEGSEHNGSWEKAASHPEVKKEQGYAHFKSFLGTRGLSALAQRSRAVDSILTANQRSMVDDFSCCLVPPQDLNSPVRIGQVEVSVQDVKLLEEIRRVPKESWPGVRKKIALKLQYVEFLKTPDVSRADMDAAIARALKAMEKARELNDEDFELQKAALGRALRGKRAKTEVPEKTRLIKQAFFLLLPGSQQVYTQMLSRSEGEH
jgi:hypothetical protein